jgi:hypothetical protein
VTFVVEFEMLAELLLEVEDAVPPSPPVAESLLVTAPGAIIAPDTDEELPEFETAPPVAEAFPPVALADEFPKCEKLFVTSVSTPIVIGGTLGVFPALDPHPAPELPPFPFPHPLFPWPLPPYWMFGL